MSCERSGRCSISLSFTIEAITKTNRASIASGPVADEKSSDSFERLTLDLSSALARPALAWGPLMRKAARFTRGGPEVIQVGATAAPILGTGQIRDDVAADVVEFAHTMAREGRTG